MCGVHICYLYILRLFYLMPIPVAARSKTLGCGRSLAGIAGSTPALGTAV